MEFKDKYSWGGWPNCLYISNGEVDIVATTDVGPRIMRYGFTGQKNLFLEIDSDMGKKGGNEFRLYGGARLWHAPEANPRCYWPDNEPVEYKWDGSAIRMLQPVEGTTGMQKEIILKVAQKSSKVEVIYRIHNKSLWPIKYSIWAITSVKNNGKAIIPQEPFQSWEDSLLPVRPMILWSYTRMNDPHWNWGNNFVQLHQDPKSDSRQKIGFLNKLCWCAYYVDGYVFIKRFNFDSGEQYPDYQCNNEVYGDPINFEIETLGPLKIVDPGSYLEHKENWYLFKTELDDSENTIKNNLLPLIEKTAIPE
jgi:hypothetical protein